MSETLKPAASISKALQKVIIIGTGFAGLGMAVALRKQGIENFLILEKSADVGGVWRDNSYPGAACDVPSHLYSFSFFPNPNWTRKFAPQGEIHAYLRDCAKKFDLLRHVRFGAEVSAAQFDEVRQHWTISMTDGTVLRAEILITAMGQLSRPAFPKMEGQDTFQGKAFHSAQWDHGFDMAGKRVAVIGTGASAIQFVPAIADKVKTMAVFQRSPAYILPRPDRAYSALEKALCRWVPWLMRLHRLAIYVQYESRALAFTRFKGLMKYAVGIPVQRLMKQQVTDPALRQRMTPDYQIGCKRILLSSGYLAAFNRSNVNLVTQGIRRITPTGVETADGQMHPVDAIVYGTGFAATEFLAPLSIKGRGGKDLSAAWSPDTKAYLGMTVPEFPNFFMLYGPNTNLGHNSIVYMIESQTRHVMRCLKKMNSSNSKVIEVLPKVYEQFTSDVQRGFASTVWNGCTSWYVDARGYNSTNWPGFTLSYRWLTRTASLNAYRFHGSENAMAGAPHAA